MVAFRPAPPVLPNRGFLLPRSWEVEGYPQLAMHLVGAFHQGFGLRKPYLRVQLDCPESRNQVFYRCGLLWSRAGICSWPSPLRFPPVLRGRPRVFLVRPTFSKRRQTFPSSGLVSRCRQ
ncbi:hypothetical protein F2Q69_00004318 [Brassica cretica]|uniref:Uncharacterized protein n=1 Tax=Brassica cretica TaxID=69181 RepID=A0A8S9P086_BRACR|nr:hypothetical protein F2Q69_00004318 [Brassica cretica]